MKTTWSGLESLEVEGEHVYLIHDAVGNVAYVGCSKDVVKRLAAHAAGKTQVGKYLLRNLPESLTWEIALAAGDKSAESELIGRLNPPFNKVLRKDSERKQDVILTPPDDPEWKDKLRAEFVGAAIDDYLEMAVMPHALGRLVATQLHRHRRHWFEQFYPEWSLEDRFAFLAGMALAGLDGWTVEVGRQMYRTALAALTERVAEVRTFFETVPMPEPDACGKLPKRDRDTINAFDVAVDLEIMPPEISLDMMRNTPASLRERTGFPLAMVNPSVEGWARY